jgi:hypothetical protein
VAINPVELISHARYRIARIAAIRASIYFLAPALTAIALGAMLPVIGVMTWHRMGYVVSPEVISDAGLALIAAGFIVVLIAAFLGWSAYRVSDDFVGAAIQVDQRVHGNEQVVTLATLSNPGTSEASQAPRSPLFPVLWRNVNAILGAFDPDKEFVFKLGGPVKESWLPTTVILVAAALAMLAFIRMPTPLEQTAIELRDLAEKIDASSASTPEDKQLAEKVKRVAINLTSPKVTPEEKKKELDAVLAEVEKKEAGAGDQPTSSSAGSGAGKGNSSSSSAAGGAQGKGQGDQSQGQQGKGAGKGEGKGSSENAQNKSGNGNGKNKGGADSIELKNELAKAQAQVQTEDLAANQAPNKPSPDSKTAQAPQPGNDPNKQGGSAKNPEQKGTAPMPVPQAGNENAANKMPNGQGPKPKSGGTGGDTHLGEFPTAANYERFLKPGEKGMALNDARYVVFKIPSGPTSGDEGKTVIDTERPRATTAYTNAPLAPTSDTAPPDERQLVPPRYRELIH